MRGTTRHSTRSNSGIRKLGYEWLGEFGIPGRRYCRKNDPVTGKRTFQLHCFARGAAEIARLLAFRDYLRAHPEKARAYEAEKRRAAALYPNNVLDYNAAKDNWIKQTEQEALIWAAGAPYGDRSSEISKDRPAHDARVQDPAAPKP